MAVGVGEGHVPEELIIRRFTVGAVAVRRGVIKRVAGNHCAGVHVGGQDEGVAEDPLHHGSGN